MTDLDTLARPLMAIILALTIGGLCGWIAAWRAGAYAATRRRPLEQRRVDACRQLTAVFSAGLGLDDRGDANAPRAPHQPSRQSHRDAAAQRRPADPPVVTP